MVLWFHSLHLTNLVVVHRGSFSDVPLTPMGPSFVHYVLSIINVDHVLRVIEAYGDVLEGVTELPCPLESPLVTQVEAALSGIEESVQATPTPLKGKDASSEQSVEGVEGKAQPSMATRAREENTVPRSSFVESGTRCWIAVPKMHPASWRLTSNSSISSPSSW